MSYFSRDKAHVGDVLIVCELLYYQLVKKLLLHIVHVANIINKLC